MTGGNFIAVCCTILNTGVTLTVTDSLSNTYTLAGSYAASGGNRQATFYAYNITGGACTITITPSATAYLNLSACEWSGVITTNPYIASSDNTGSATTTFTTGSVTIGAEASALVVAGFCIATSNKNYTANGPLGGFWSSTDSNTQLSYAGDAVVAAALNASMSVNASSSYAAHGASFKIVQPSSGGAARLIGGVLISA